MADINFIGGGTLGKIKTWNSKKISQIQPVPLPTQDAGRAVAYDTLGVYEIVDFTGKWTGDFQTIQGNIQSIKTIADGNQTSAVKLRSPFVNTTDGTGSRVNGTLSTNTSATTNKLVDTGRNFTTIGTQVGDVVKNLITEATANVTVIDSATQLTLDADIFPSSGVSYALTGTINCKVIAIETNWQLPGMNYCDYKISIVQVEA